MGEDGKSAGPRVRWAMARMGLWAAGNAVWLVAAAKWGLHGSIHQHAIFGALGWNLGEELYWRLLARR